MDKTTVITIATHKGGAGKSSIVGNLGYALGDLGYKILLIDTDSQKNLSHSYGFIKENPNKNFFISLTSTGDSEYDIYSSDIRNHILKTEFENIDIVIGDVALATIEKIMALMDYREKRVETILKGVLKDNYYDFILFDTNSSLGILNTSILSATDEILIPVIPSYFGLEGLGVFMSHFKNIKKEKEDVNLLGVVLNAVDKRESISNEVVKIVNEVFGENLLLDTILVKDINVDKAQGKHKPIASIFKNSRAVECYTSLAKEVVNLVKKRKKCC